MNPHFNSVSPGLLRRPCASPSSPGQDFDDRLGTPARKAAVVNQTFARKYFGDKSPLGFHLGWDGPGRAPPDIEIIGVVADAKYENLDEAEIPRQIFVAYPQNDWATGMTVYVRSSLPSEQLIAAVRDEVKGLDAGIPIFDLTTMEDQLDRSLAIQKLVAFLSSAFGGLATVLALVGLYGVTAYGVARRRREIGIRMALGAESSQVVRDRPLRSAGAGRGRRRDRAAAELVAHPARAQPALRRRAARSVVVRDRDRRAAAGRGAGGSAAGAAGEPGRSVGGVAVRVSRRAARPRAPPPHRAHLLQT